MPEEAAKKLVMLTLDGVDEHHGHVMARALVEKLDGFLKTFAGFERVFLNTRSRRTDFEVVELKHNSPASLGLRPVTRVANYHPTPAVEWTFAQWDRITRGQEPDDSVDEDLIADIADLARRSDALGYGSFVISYEGRTIPLGDDACINASRLQIERHATRRRPPWRAGISRGSVSGELRSILDANSERQIVICPAVGPAQVRCVFRDDMKEAILRSMWKHVKISGLMHYSDASPHPVLIDIESIGDTPSLDALPHISSGAGLFKGGHYEGWVSSVL